MEDLVLCDSEFRLCDIVWGCEPLGSGQLARLAGEQLGWKKSTTYTVLKKLCQRGILQNEGAVVTALVKREQVQRAESEQLLQKAFGGSLPRFLNAFMGGRRLSAAEAEELKGLIDSYREE